MSEIVDAAVKALNARLGGRGVDGSVRFVIEDAGALLIDEDGARADDGDADCVMTADADTFRAMLDGDLDPTAAFMSGRLRVDGDMSLAMKLGALLG
jgi:putative sterol carrier protein